MNLDNACILHLRILPSEKSVENDILTYSPNLPIEPAPYESDVLSSHYQIDQSSNVETINTNAEHSSISCWWDCQPFEGQIYRIPIGVKDNVVQAFGYFCSPACAAAYNLDSSKQFGSNKWYNMELLQKMYGRTCIAPPRECMTHFGGQWSLAQFRKNKEPIRTLYPPIYLIKPHYEISSDYENVQSFIPIDPSKVAIAEKQLKLSRSETKTNRENMSLDMFISINKKD